MIAPYYCRGGITLYCGRVEDIAPHLHHRGIVLTDAPYSPWVHAKSRAGARTVPLLDGNGRMSKAAISRKKEFGFDHLTPELRRFLAEQAARLASRWALFFTDAEGLGKWQDDLNAAGMPYRTHLIWRKLCGTPQFTGMQAATPDETIALASVELEELYPWEEYPDDWVEVAPEDDIAGGHIAVAHRPPGVFVPIRHWNGGGKQGYYEVPVANAKYGQGQDRRLNETQKPERLIKELILDWSNPGEPLIDLTAGSCTTLAVAARLGHPAIGIEARESQCKKAVRRLDNILKRESLIQAGTAARVKHWLERRAERKARADGRPRPDKSKQTTIFDVIGHDPKEWQ